ncbi:MAG: DUF6671 family protein [Saprospiraceae bacterium]
MVEKNLSPSHKDSSFFIQGNIFSHFKDRTAVLATKHGKERAIAPVLWESLGLRLTVSDKIDTDTFGTFAGDVERPASQFETAAIKATNCLALHPEAGLALASEGAFYPHPEVPFLTMNTEIVLLMGREPSLTIAGYHHSTETLATSEEIATTEELLDFANRLKFPEFGLILKVKTGEKHAIKKDLNSLASLLDAFRSLRSKHEKITVETDLRAHRNPLRMKMIGQAAADLVRRILATCPNCGHPDFVVKDFEKGLPCELCSLPTRLPLKDIKACGYCGFREEILFPKGEKAYAGHCDWCNP